jgi:hypothetical protein
MGRFVFRACYLLGVIITTALTNMLPEVIQCLELENRSAAEN